MITVWKYKLELTDRQLIKLPTLSKPLCAGIDGNNNLVLWVLVETENELIEHLFRIVGTGHEIGKPIPSYLNTVKVELETATLFWHVFWEGELYDLATRKANECLNPT